MANIYRFWNRDTGETFEKHGRSLLEILCSEPEGVIFCDHMEKILNPRVDKALLVPKIGTPEVADLYILAQPGKAHVAPQPACPYAQVHLTIEGVKPGELPPGSWGFGIALPWERLGRSIDLNPMILPPNTCGVQAKIGVLLGVLDGFFNYHGEQLGVLDSKDYDSMETIIQALITKLGAPYRTHMGRAYTDEERPWLKLIEFWSMGLDPLQAVSKGIHLDDPVQTWQARANIMWHSYRVQLFLYHQRIVPALRYHVEERGGRLSPARIAKRAGIYDTTLQAAMDDPSRLNDRVIPDLAKVLDIPREFLRSCGQDLHYYVYTR